MAKYINIEKFESASPCCPNCGNDCKHECEFFTSIFAEDIVEDIAPVIHAEWQEWFSTESNTIVYDCSNCLETNSKNSGYCPNCGAKMDKERI